MACVRSRMLDIFPHCAFICLRFLFLVGFALLNGMIEQLVTISQILEVWQDTEALVIQNRCDKIVHTHRKCDEITPKYDKVFPHRETPCNFIDKSDARSNNGVAENAGHKVENKHNFLPRLVAPDTVNDYSGLTDRMTTDVADNSDKLTEPVTAQNNVAENNCQGLQIRITEAECNSTSCDSGVFGLECLSLYHGVSDFDEWLSEFDRVRIANNWSDAVALKMLPVRLRGNAAVAFDELKSSEKFTLTDLIYNLRAEFEPEELVPMYIRKLFEFQMDPHEPVAKFASNLQKLVRKAHRGMSKDAQEILLRDYFIQKVGRDIKQPLLLVVCL